MNYLCIAMRMLNIKNVIDLPRDLVNKLSKINLLVTIAGGELRSRQIVAVVITQWIWDNPRESKKFARKQRRKNAQ